MTIGAVIVTYNSKNTVCACIDSVRSEGVSDIVIVDSNSTDGTQTGISNLDAQVIVLDKNRGFGFAANAGADLLNTDYVLFINPDAYLKPGALSSMMRVMSSRKKIGIVGGMLVDGQGVPEQYSFGQTVTPFGIVMRARRSKKSVSGPVSVGWVSGGALLVNRRVFQSIGGFDDGFFLYWEDVDLCRRIKECGFDVYIDPNATVVHVRGASSADIREKTELYDASATRYFQKYYPPFIWRTHLIARKIYRLVRPLAY